MEKIRATDTLANERTFLAYLRTALAFVAFGFVIARFGLFLREAAVIAHENVPAMSERGAIVGTVVVAVVALGVAFALLAVR